MISELLAKITIIVIFFTQPRIVQPKIVWMMCNLIIKVAHTGARKNTKIWLEKLPWLKESHLKFELKKLKIAVATYIRRIHVAFSNFFLLMTSFVLDAKIVKSIRSAFTDLFWLLSVEQHLLIFQIYWKVRFTIHFVEMSVYDGLKGREKYAKDSSWETCEKIPPENLCSVLETFT